MKKLKELFHLFLTMFKIGLVTFGGGYAMIAIIERELVEKKGWIEHEEYMDVIAIAESTPGPLAINTATYIGYKIKGVLGSVFATLGVVLPSFIIIFIIASLVKGLLKFAGVKAFLNGVRPVVVGLIIGTGIVLALTVILSYKTINSQAYFDWKALLIFATVACIHFVFKKKKKKAISPILLIAISAIMGMILYGLL